MVKQRTFILALAAALLMLLLVGSVAFADGNPPENAPAITTPPGNPPAGGEIVAPVTEFTKGPVCVDGYVINHREQPVDGTKTKPPLVVVAVFGDNPDPSQAGLAGQVVGTANVGQDGYFKFPNLPAGMINFRLQLPQWWEGIVPQVSLNGLAETGFTNFTASKTCYRILFKIRRTVEIPVYKWEESLEGIVTPGNDWTITATPIKDPFARVVTVVTKGGQAVLRLTPGTWSVAETVKPGWEPITPPVVIRIVDQYQDPREQILPIVFKNRKPVCYATINVIKLGYGTGKDGQRVTLGPLSGWDITVSRADKTWPGITKTTGGDGRVTFDHLYPGVYKVTETVQSGWKALGDNPVTVVLMDCQTANVTFDNKELIGQLTISGKKLFKAWEKPFKGTLVGLPGWTITAALVGTGTSTSTVTNALGEYTFTEAMLGPGMAFPGASIEVCEEDRDHWIHVTPKCVTVKFPYPVPPDYTGEKINFINVQDPPLAGMTYTAPAAGATASAGCSVYHMVSTGDTLAKIAGKYGASANAIIRANGIRNADVIYLGQRICIP